MRLIRPRLKKMACSLHKAHYSKMATVPLIGFIASSRGLFQEESNLRRVCTRDGFDLNAYKLLKKSGYDFSKPRPLGNVIDVRLYGLNSKQKVIHRQGGRVVTPRISLRCIPT